MKKKNYKKIAITGIASGIFLINQLHGAHPETSNASPKTTLEEMESADGGNYGYHLMTEDELKLELNGEGLKLFESLSPEGKKLALEVASNRCNGQNKCKGLNACKTDTNDCAGKGDCKGKSKCAVSDKNLAVKLVSKKMEEKRNQATEKK